VDCAHNGAARTSVKRAVERDRKRSVFFAIERLLANWKGRRRAGTLRRQPGIATKRPAVDKGWSFWTAMLARDVPGINGLDSGHEIE
jgi:hypothetical protein